MARTKHKNQPASAADAKRKAEPTDKASKKTKVLSGSPLDVLLKGMSIKEFDRDIFEKKHLLLKQIDTCSGLFSRKALLDVLSKHPLAYTSDLTVTVYKDNERRNFEPPADSDGIAKSKQVASLLSQGYSVQFYQPQRYVDELCAFNAALEAHYGCLAGSSAYLTPPKSQALAPHHDDVDVFILQTEGSKHWKLYAPLTELAGEHSNDLEQSAIGEPIFEVTLEEGDMLYFPRGVIHQACTSDSFSTHVTISIYHHNSWANFMEVALPRVLRRAFEKDVAFRKGLPPNWLGFMGTQFASNGSSTARATDFTKNFRHLATTMLEHINEKDLHVAADDAAVDFIQHRLPPLDQSAKWKKALLKDDLALRLRHKAFTRIVLQDDAVTLLHAVQNCRQHHMGVCICDHDDDEDDEDMHDEDDEDEDQVPPPASGITFPVDCAPVLLHLYTTAPQSTTMTAMMEKNVAPADTIRGVVFRLIAEDMVEKI
ncbi:unnamed protein product [Aphanomyces euteiches]|uniref:Bifunctional lysine-specific demethylase and histidyl-hydroxylase n=1 Tax=Aphanomyces euteiches TaxID=100861 RepID=A0A6G0XT23_9STRA|nr:hypothetical protein Ae201684_001789 [Aphanomyces euteiches]